MLRAEYESRGPASQDVIHAVAFEAPPLEAGQALLEVIAAPIVPSDVLTLTGELASCHRCRRSGARGRRAAAELGTGTAPPPIGQLVLLPAGCASGSTHVVPEANSWSRSRTRLTRCSSP